MTRIPIVVDLDGTLLKTDLLWETASEFVTRHPLQAFNVGIWLLQGRSHLKSELARRVGVDVTSLPFNHGLIDWLRQQKQDGARLILATASHISLARAIAEHLGIFDEVLASDDEVNLKGKTKRDALVSRFGLKGFDYVGDSTADRAVWTCANRGYAVRRPGGDWKWAAGHGVTVLDTQPDTLASGLPSLVRAMRLHQWLKNLLVFVPLFTAHLYGDVQSIIRASILFACFCLAASSVYLLNDIVDVSVDRLHESKRRRPVAAGNLSLLHAWLAWPILVLGSLGLAFATLSADGTVALAVYLLATVAYSFGLKRIPIVDVLTLAVLYTLRIIAGAAVIAVPLSFWLVMLSIFIFTSLALIKRFAELKKLDVSFERNTLHGRGYLRDDIHLISMMGTTAGYLAVLVFGLFIHEVQVNGGYSRPEVLWAGCILLLFWISRVWLIAHRGLMHEDPIVFAARDRASWLTAASIVFVFVVARFG